MVWGCLVWFGAETASCKGAVQDKSRHKVRGRKKGFARLRGTLPPPLILLWLHLLHVTGGGHWRQPQPQPGGGEEPAAALPAPAQLSLRKGEQEPDEGEEKLPAELPPRIGGASWNGHWTVLTWRFPPPREPQEFEDRREKGEACREHQRMRGALKGTGEFFEKTLSCTEMLSGEGAIICLPFCSDERSQQGRP